MEKLELVFMPSIGISHLVSSIEFAKRITERDSRVWVTVLMMSPLQPTKDLNLVYSHSKIRFVDLPQVDSPSYDCRKTPGTNMCAFVENHSSHVKHALTQLASNSATGLVLVLDLFCLSMIDVANELGIPSYLFLTTGTFFLGAMLYLVPHDESTGTVFELSCPELTIPSFTNPVPSRVLPDSFLDKAGGYAAFAKLGKRFKEVKGIVVNSFSDLEAFGLSSVSDGENPPVYPVGPILKLNSGSDPIEKDPIISWLDEQPPSSVVFLCFGSMGSLSAPQVREIACGLEQSGYRPGDESKIVTAEKIKEVIRRAMEDDGGVRERMKEMRGKSRKAVMDGGSSFNSCGRLIEDMINNYQRCHVSDTS
ncbi:hypothetical protein RJ641_016468 [Dillenia turbinata]|uniref:Uncharacterized protein n=1 Tax=Dillenia turbinata TaxID=194707 RepID=A0AAN8YYQ7_9MAGN